MSEENKGSAVLDVMAGIMAEKLIDTLGLKGTDLLTESQKRKLGDAVFEKAMESVKRSSSFDLERSASTALRERLREHLDERAEEIRMVVDNELGEESLKKTAQAVTTQFVESVARRMQERFLGVLDSAFKEAIRVVVSDLERQASAGHQIR